MKLKLVPPTVTEYPLPALFLDRDGTIIREWKGQKKYFPNQVEILPEIKESLSTLLSIRDLKVFVITRQNDIGRNLIDWAKLKIIHNRIDELLELDWRHQTILEYFVAPNPQVSKASLIVQAADKYRKIDLLNSYFIGNADEDIIAGNSFGMTTFRLMNDFGSDIVRPYKEPADFIVESFKVACIEIAKMCCHTIKESND